MADHEQSTIVDAPAESLFDYLSEVRNLPEYFSAMTSAEPAEGEAVHTTATVEGREVEGEAWFRVDQGANRIEWGSEGEDDYRGWLEVSASGAGSGSTVKVGLHTAGDADGGRIEGGLSETLANIKRVVEERGRAG